MTVPRTRKTRRKSENNRNHPKLIPVLGNSKTSPKSHTSPPKSFLVAFLIIPKLLLDQTSLNRKFPILTPNWANIILILHIFQLPTQPHYSPVPLLLRSKWPPRAPFGPKSNRPRNPSETRLITNETSINLHLTLNIFLNQVLKFWAITISLHSFDFP